MGRASRASAPYLLLLPVVVVIGAILGYPLYKLVTLSFQRYGLPELIQRKGEWIGLDNYESVLRDEIFWDTLLRTVVFTAANVALTMVLGTLIALLLVRVSTWVRVLLSAGLVLVWAMPAVVAVQVFYWMTNFENGVLNYVLAQLGLGDSSSTTGTRRPSRKLAMVTLLIVWGAIPFVAITVYAGLAQVPRELVEAAEIDGAGPLRVFRDVTFPILKPIFLILTSLSIIWDFGVFTQPYLLIGAAHLDPTNYLMGVYVFVEGYAQTDFGRGAAISLLMLLIVAVLSVVLRAADGPGGGGAVSSAVEPRPAVRRRARRRRLERAAWNVVGLAVFVVMVFPVYWMVSTAFKPDDRDRRRDADLVPSEPTLAHFRDAIDSSAASRLLGRGQEQPDHRRRHGRALDRASRSSPRSRSRSTASRAGSCSSS